jgi:predicted ATPase
VLTSIELNYFKCFERLDLPLGPLTLLSGTNAAGKSSVLQALVLLHQTIREHEWSTRLMLNGQALELGTVQDVVDKVHGRRSFEIGIRSADDYVSWSFTGDRDEMSMAVERVRVTGVNHPSPKLLQHLVPPDTIEPAKKLARRLRDLSYITAERVGPRQIYSLEDQQAARVVGPRGEHTASVLYRGRDEDVPVTRCLPEASPKRLRQIEAWMRRFFPGCGIDVQPVQGANAVTLGLRTSDDTSFHRPVHVGFGLTQVLPIIVAAVSAAPQDLLLIENPEVHLHPAGQAQMGAFLAEVAASGVQVVIETHSDHVLNGIRRTVRAGKLPPSDAVLHFFRPRKPGEDQVVSPVLDATGNIDFWPPGFFDQFEKDLSHLAGWGD